MAIAARGAGGLDHIVVVGGECALLFRYKTNSAWLVLGGALVGLTFTCSAGAHEVPDNEFLQQKNIIDLRSYEPYS